MFITLAFVIRIIEALGNAAFLTSSFAIIAKEFPNSVGTTFATLETFFGLGLIAGPMVSKYSLKYHEKLPFFLMDDGTELLFLIKSLLRSSHVLNN